MTKIRFANERTVEKVKNLEQGTCFIQKGEYADSTNLYMKTQFIPVDEYSLINCICLSTGRVTYVEPEEYVVVLDVDMVASEAM